MKYQNSRKLQNASNDLRFLLNRGYRKVMAIDFVGNHYLLNKKERNFLNRTVFSQAKSRSRKSKVIPICKIKGNTLLIDGYNILITIESICSNEDSLIISDDGVMRDVNAVFGKYKFKEITENALNAIVSLIRVYQPKDVKVFYDKPVSYSGKLAKLTGRIMENHGIIGNAETAVNVDYQLIKLYHKTSGVVATSDGIIMDKVDYILDIPCYIYKIKKKNLSLSKFIIN
ncbi:MAG: DUF434 domain-containing protein [Methanobacterium sp.]|jgi:hypothetical protein